MDFRSDNVVGAHPKVVEAVLRANASGPDGSYGTDAITARVRAKLCEIFETDALVAHMVATGTAANALALACCTPPWGAVYCHPQSHIVVDEANAPEFYSGGAKLVPVEGFAAKMDADKLATALDAGGYGVVHHPQPAAVSITQATECGAIYTPAEIAHVSALAKRHGLKLHMDGARFANALVRLGCTPAQMSWKAGVDVLSFGATKNGCFGVEVVIFFDKALATEFEFRRKRAGHLFSKLRFLSAQVEGYLADDAWLASARHANAMATALADGLGWLPGVHALYPVEANELFVILPDPAKDALERAGFKFYPWPNDSDRPGASYRMVTAFDTDPKHVALAVDTARKALKA